MNNKEIKKITNLSKPKNKKRVSDILKAASDLFIGADRTLLDGKQVYWKNIFTRIEFYKSDLEKELGK